MSSLPEFPVSSVALARPALLRSRRRRNSRGATVFIVTLVMTLLTAMGIFAARAASVTELGAGYDRENEQTHYVLEHGVMLTAAQISVAPAAAKNFAQNPTLYNNRCLSGQWFQPIPNFTYACIPYNGPALAAGSQTAQQQNGVSTIVAPFDDTHPVGATIPDPNADNNVPGSLGPNPVTPQVSVELTDAGEVGRPPAGSATGSSAGASSLKYYAATLGAWGQIGPWVKQGEVCNAITQNFAITTAREVGRAYITLGPT